MCRHGEASQRLAVALAPGRFLRVVLQRRRRRTLAIHVHRDATVEVRVPVACPLGTVVEFVRRRRAWIMRQLEWVATYPPTRALQYTQGEHHRYIGEWVMLALRSGSPRQGQLVAGRLLLTLRGSTDPTRVKRLLEQWYRDRASEIFAERLAYWSEHPAYGGLGLPPLRLRRMSRRWGSCSSRGVITLNTGLVKRRLELIDYVVVHELCHLRVFDHSARFYALLDKVLPDWRRRHRALAHL
ncbi:predicted metal-dependent hydrolase [Nitrococcus mobilis Nb-231]|uniref:Predicted metal-dependent hydrolase n=2 Tax=Nitrococcus mobilis TaxID=35797 RepID=A4BSX4_9GAMM|nr:predicted metal-dependent hydrolase [Nitrococcus mobilis Nb-231]